VIRVRIVGQLAIPLMAKLAAVSAPIDDDLKMLSPVFAHGVTVNVEPDG
jgi:hypothetical protein